MSLKLNSSGGGSVTLQEPTTASNFTLTLPAATATVATTTGTLTNPTINGFTGDTSVINVGSGQFYKDASGNVAVGNTSPAVKLHVSGGVGSTGGSVVSTGAAITMYYDAANDYGVISTLSNGVAWKPYHIRSAGMVFKTTSDVEAGRFYTNGNFGLTNSLDFVGGAGTVRIHLAGGSPTNSNTGIAAAWNVHSDYRLKENVTPLADALQKVAALKPITFSWIGEEAQTITGGFLAHELAEQVPYAVMGEKDAVNDEGAIISQAADYSKVVPLLTAALQEAVAKIEALEARLAALETK